MRKFTQQDFEEKLKNLKITDDLVFRNVIELGDNCLHLLQAIFPELNIEKVEFETQKHEKVEPLHRGTILDLYATDEEGRVYDIEVQTTLAPYQDKRFRYYQSKLDERALLAGHSIEELQSTYIVVLFTEDPIGRDKKYYRFGMCDLEDKDIELDTGAELLYLNPKGHKGEVSENLQGLFDMINGKINVENEFVDELENGMNIIKEDPKWRHEFMNLQMRFDDIKYEAKQQAARQTREQDAKKLIATLQSLNISDDQIKKTLFENYKNEIPTDKLQKIYDEIVGIK